jgi:NAD+ synthase (glutamine-hydrolysing)
MKIALAQLDYHIGNFERNSEKIIQSILRAKNESADLVVFAELALTGYPPRDFLEFEDFIRLNEEYLEKIRYQAKGIAVILGAPSVNPNADGKHLFNSAYFLENQKTKSVVNKTLLPTYDVFDEHRYFEPNRHFSCILLKGKKIALTICEDTWDIGDDPMYTANPLEELSKESPDLIVNISASPFSHSHPERRREMLNWNCKKYKIPMILVNHVGAQTELIFDGGSMAYSSEGELIASLNYFEEDFKVIDLNRQSKSITHPHRTKMHNVRDALVLGVRDYFGKLNFQTAVLGLSGGIDSSVTAAIAVAALGNNNVQGIMLPSVYTSDESLEDALLLASNLGIHTETIPITDAFQAVTDSLSSVFVGLPKDLTEENIQARLRSIFLMALANKHRYVLLNTSNKSEIAVGYGTLYGDLSGGLSVIGDLYKTEVYELAKFLNQEQELIPSNCLTKAPSAELRPNQKDSDSLPEYPILDKILYRYIERCDSPEQIVNLDFDPQLVRSVLSLVNLTEYKRYQTPPILRVSTRAFGMGRRMPIVGKYLP